MESCAPFGERVFEKVGVEARGMCSERKTKVGGVQGCTCVAVFLLLLLS